MGGIHQLFQRAVDEDTLHRMLHAFGLKDLNDTSRFCKCDLIALGTAPKLAAMGTDLTDFYLPSKRPWVNVHYDPVLNAAKCITLLRQVVRLYGCKLEWREKLCAKGKCARYHLCAMSDAPAVCKRGLMAIDARTTLMSWD